MSQGLDPFRQCAAGAGERGPINTFVADASCLDRRLTQQVGDPADQSTRLREDELRQVGIGEIATQLAMQLTRPDERQCLGQADVVATDSGCAIHEQVTLIDRGGEERVMPQLHKLVLSAGGDAHVAIDGNLGR
jgi:hypothetical protein